MSAANIWVTAHRTTVLFTIVVFAVMVRVTYFAQLAGSPLLETHRWRQSDMHYYDAWARDLAAGDWWWRTGSLPMHRWHHDVASRYFSEHSDERAAAERAAIAAQTDADTIVWARWMHLPQYYQDPLYAYAVGVTYRLLRPDVRFVFAWQSAGGVVTIVLIWLLTRRYFDDCTAAVACAAAALCGPLLFYELLLLRDSLAVMVGLLVVWLASRATAQSQRRTRWAIVGVAAGVSFLLKGSFILLGGGIVLAVLITERQRVRTLAPLLGGAALAVAPLMIRNAAVGVPPLSLVSSGPLTFVASNDVAYLPDVGFGIHTPVLARFLGDTDGGWVQAVRSAAQSNGLWSYLSLTWRKWDRAWHWYEIPNNENFYYARLEVPVLAWLPLTFWVIAPLALVGAVLAANRLWDRWPLYLLLSASVAPLVVFYVLGRFRVALIAVALPFAAAAVMAIARHFAAREYARGIGLVAAVCVIGLWTGRPIADDQVLIRTADWILPYSAYYQPRVEAAADLKAWSRAAQWYQEFFDRYEPSVGEIMMSRDRSLPTELASMHRECAELFVAAGNRDSASAQLAASDRLLELAAR